MREGWYKRRELCGKGQITGHSKGESREYWDRTYYLKLMVLAKQKIRYDYTGITVSKSCYQSFKISLVGDCYPSQPSFRVDNSLLDLLNSSYQTRPQSITANYNNIFKFHKQLWSRHQIKHCIAKKEFFIRAHLNRFRSSQWVNTIMSRNNRNLHERVLNSAPTSTSLWSSVLISIPSVYGWRTSSLNNSLCTYSNNIKKLLRASKVRSNRNRIRARSERFSALPKSHFLKNLSLQLPFLIAQQAKRSERGCFI